MKRFVVFLLLMSMGLALATPARAQPDEALPALVELLRDADDPQFQSDLLKGMIDGLKGRRGVAMPPGWETVETKLNASPNAAVRDMARSLSLTFGSARAKAALRQQLADRTADAAVRKSALDSLLAAKDPSLASLLQELLGDPVMRGAALRGLAGYDDPKSAEAILSVYPKLTVTDKRDALNTLVSRVAFAKPLLAAVSSGIVPARDLTADIVRSLRQLNDDGIQKQIASVWGVARESQADKLQEIEKYKTMIAAGPAGDLSRGRAVFARVCVQCHTLFDVGGKVGPDITGSNRGDVDYLLQNVLDPNAVIPNDYRTSTLETKDDRVISGIVMAQDANAVTIVTANERLVVPRNEITSLRQGEISMMPEGLVQALTDAEVRDLIAYLRSPAQVPMEARPDNLE